MQPRQNGRGQACGLSFFHYLIVACSGGILQLTDVDCGGAAAHRFFNEFKPSHCGKSFGFLILLNEAYPLSCRQLALLAQTSYIEASFDVKGQ
jgi:hypothetical protein